MWAVTKQVIGELRFNRPFDFEIRVHLQNIYDTAELRNEATTEKISVVRREGNRDVNRTLKFCKRVTVCLFTPIRIVAQPQKLSAVT